MDSEEKEILLETLKIAKWALTVAIIQSFLTAISIIVTLLLL